MKKLFNVLLFTVVFNSIAIAVQMLAGYVYSVGVGTLNHKNPFVITSLSMDMVLLGQSFFGRYDITIKQDVVEFRER